MARALPSQGGGGGFLGMRAEEEPGEGGEQAPDGGCEAVDGEEAPGPSPGPLTRGALGLDGPPPQGPLTQNHVAAAPPDLEDAPQQSPVGRCLRLRQGRPQRGRRSSRLQGRLFLPAALQGAHTAASPPSRHGVAAGCVQATGPRRPFRRRKTPPPPGLQPRRALPQQRRAGQRPRREARREAGRAGGAALIRAGTWARRPPVPATHCGKTPSRQRSDSLRLVTTVSWDSASRYSQLHKAALLKLGLRYSPPGHLVKNAGYCCRSGMRP